MERELTLAVRLACFLGGWALWYFVFHGQNIWLVLDTALVLREFDLTRFGLDRRS